MLQGWGSCLVDECNCVGPIFFEGVNNFSDWRGLVLVGDPFFVLFGVHSASSDDVQADINDVTIFHWVACYAHKGCAYEEAHHKGLKTI